MQIARNMADLTRVLAESRVAFEVTRVRASATDQWQVVDGALQHQSSGFFSVVGVRPDAGGGGCVLLYQPQGAVTGLLCARIDGELCYLLQARAEPGCLGEAQFGPTVQSTPANFMRLHGGAATPYIESFIMFEPGLTLVDDTTQLDLGLRYFCKTKRSILAEAAVPPPLQPSFVWATREAICAACLESAFLNIDLRSILSIAAWASDKSENGLTPRSEEIRRNLAAPIRPEALGQVLSALGAVARNAVHLAPLTSLENWRETEWGWSERERRQGFDVDFFEVQARFREKSMWVQPLVNSASEGQVTLVCRERLGFLEFFVRVVPEIGLAASAALAPSYVRYPGADAPPRVGAGAVWSATRESDEGGRFYRDASRYEIVRGDDLDAPSSGAWVRLPELKLLLRMSNVCTIQLRGVVSQLLGVR